MFTTTLHTTSDLSACITVLSELTQGHRTLYVIDDAVAGQLSALLPTPPDYSIVASGGEGAKSLSLLTQIWDTLLQREMSRHDYIVCIGGGALTDIAGLAASTYKRGMQLIYVPTTLLGAVDAAIGGKTAIDYGGLKNSIGTFYPPHALLLCPPLMHTLPTTEIISGWGEVVKYSLISRECPLSATDWSLLRQGSLPHDDTLQRCMQYKIDLTTRDLTDRGPRQYLNFGHTIGHALEALMWEQTQPIPHGIAIAAGMVVELYLSLIVCALDQRTMMRQVRLIQEHFPSVYFECKQYDTLLQRMQQDKKNVTAGSIASILLTDIGVPTGPTPISKAMIYEALDFYRDFMHVG